jgi:predicted Zn-dependent protease
VTQPVQFFDGQTARPQPVRLGFAADALEIEANGVVLARWPYDAVRDRQGGDPALLRLGLADDASLARLEIADVATQNEVSARCGRLHAGREGGRPDAIIGWSIAAAVSVIACVLFLVPLAADYAAPLVPVSVERRLGQAVDNQVRALFGGKVCEGGEGRGVLDTLTRRLLEASGKSVTVDVAVLDTSSTNALALPGGRVYVLRGLLDKAQTADELAGVLAHEIGHVAHRDGLRRLIQSGGTSFLLGLLLGDVTGGGAIVLATRLMIDSSHSREAERAADAFAADAMLVLGRSPLPIAQFLKRIVPEDKGLALLSTHPLTEERLAALQGREPRQPGPPLLTDSEWQALKAICKG